MSKKLQVVVEHPDWMDKIRTRQSLRTGSCLFLDGNYYKITGHGWEEPDFVVYVKDV